MAGRSQRTSQSPTSATRSGSGDRRQQAGGRERMGPIMDRDFDLRRSVYELHDDALRRHVAAGEPLLPTRVFGDGTRS